MKALWAGEGLDLIDSIGTAAEPVASIVRVAQQRIEAAGRLLVTAGRVPEQSPREHR